MPELPEVETIRRGLAPAVSGRTLERLDVLDARWCAPAAPSEVARQVAGRRVERLSRRGKYLVWELAGDVHLVMHLRMTGNLLVRSRGEAAPPHTRVRFVLTGADEVAFTDPRRFGTGVVLVGRDARDAYFSARLGVEPLDPAFTGEALRALARGRRAPVKAFLLSQERIAGVGNIYADEALFRARIHPLRPVGTLTVGHLRRLRDAVVDSLEAGIAARGATIDDFRHPDGASGSFQNEFLVHRRAGEGCRRCGRAITKIRAAGRGTYVCTRCQRPPSVRRATGRSEKRAGTRTPTAGSG